MVYIEPVGIAVEWIDSDGKSHITYRARHKTREILRDLEFKEISKPNIRKRAENQIDEEYRNALKNNEKLHNKIKKDVSISAKGVRRVFYKEKCTIFPDELVKTILYFPVNREKR